MRERDKPTAVPHPDAGPIHTLMGGDRHPIRPYEEHHYRDAEDVGIAFNSNRVWFCINGVSVLRAKVMLDGRLFVEFNPPVDAGGECAFCPGCNANMRGDKIPDDKKHLYGATHGSRLIAIYSRTLDATVAYKCPDCGVEWDRE